MSTVTLLGIDIGKNTFHLHDQDARGNQFLRKKLNRSQLLSHLAQLSNCKIAMESCGGSQWRARRIEGLSHRVQLIAVQDVRIYVTGNKNDFVDAEAICEAASRLKTRSVPVKTVEQQILSTEHKLRKPWVDHRTGIINQVHGFLLEFGIIFPIGYAALKQAPALMEKGVHSASASTENRRQAFVYWCRSYDDPEHNGASQIDQRIAAGLHRIETVGKSSFGRKTLSQPEYGPKYGLGFLKKKKNKKTLNSQGFNV